MTKLQYAIPFYLYVYNNLFLLPVDGTSMNQQPQDIPIPNCPLLTFLAPYLSITENYSSTE